MTSLCLITANRISVYNLFTAYFGATGDFHNWIINSLHASDFYHNLIDYIRRYPWLSYKSYHQISNISRTKSQNIKRISSRLAVGCPMPNPLKTGNKSKIKMLLEQRRQAIFQLHLSDRQFYGQLRCGLYLRFDHIVNMLDNIIPQLLQNRH